MRYSIYFVYRGSGALGWKGIQCKTQANMWNKFCRCPLKEQEESCKHFLICEPSYILKVLYHIIGNTK